MLGFGFWFLCDLPFRILAAVLILTLLSASPLVRETIELFTFNSKSLFLLFPLKGCNSLAFLFLFDFLLVFLFIAVLHRRTLRFIPLVVFLGRTIKRNTVVVYSDFLWRQIPEDVLVAISTASISRVFHEPGVREWN